MNEDRFCCNCRYAQLSSSGGDWDDRDALACHHWDSAKYCKIDKKTGNILAPKCIDLRHLKCRGVWYKPRPLDTTCYCDSTPTKRHVRVLTRWERVKRLLLLG